MIIYSFQSHSSIKIRYSWLWILRWEFRVFTLILTPNILMSKNHVCFLNHVVPQLNLTSDLSSHLINSLVEEVCKNLEHHLKILRYYMSMIVVYLDTRFANSALKLVCDSLIYRQINFKSGPCIIVPEHIGVYGCICLARCDQNLYELNSSYFTFLFSLYKEACT